MSSGEYAIVVLVSAPGVAETDCQLPLENTCPPVESVTTTCEAMLTTSIAIEAEARVIFNALVSLAQSYRIKIYWLLSRFSTNACNRLKLQTGESNAHNAASCFHIDLGSNRGRDSATLSHYCS